MDDNMNIKSPREPKVEIMQWLGEKSFDELYEFANADKNYGIVGMLNGKGNIAQIRTVDEILNVKIGDLILKDEIGELSLFIPYSKSNDESKDSSNCNCIQVEEEPDQDLKYIGVGEEEPEPLFFKCPDCGADLSISNGKVEFIKHNI